MHLRGEENHNPPTQTVPVAFTKASVEAMWGILNPIVFFKAVLLKEQKPKITDKPFWVRDKWLQY